MNIRSCLLVVVWLLGVLAIAPIASAEDEKPDEWEVRGRVVDATGKLTDDFEAAINWSANGDLKGKIAKYGWNGGEKVWGEEGQILAEVPVGERVGKGRFKLMIHDRTAAAVFVCDKDHKHGAVMAVRRDSAKDETKFVLQPLAHVHGQVFCPARNRTPDRTDVSVYLIGENQNLLCFTACVSLKGVFSFKLPPGKYGLAASGYGPDSRMPPFKNSSATAAINAADRPLPYGLVVNVSREQSEFDLGVLNVEPPAGATGDYSEYYGKAPPELVISDAKGISPAIKLADLRGKWVVLEFWATWCGPCIYGGLPKLMEFYDAHAADRECFEILTICQTEGDDQRTVADYERLVASTVKDVWKGRELPFPVLIDHDAKTRKAYGFNGIPKLLLIDPDGNLVKDGRLEMLAEKLKERTP